MAGSKGLAFFTGLLIGMVGGGAGGYYFATHGGQIPGLSASGMPHTPASVQKSPSKPHPMTAPLPDPARARQMVTAGMDLFGRAVLQGDMKEFYRNISRLWQNKTTPQALNKNFQPFLRAKIDLRPLRKLEPVLTRGPLRLKNGDLLIEGYYPTRPNRVYFRQIYHLENGIWKLSAFYIQLKKAPQ